MGSLIPRDFQILYGSVLFLLNWLFSLLVNKYMDLSFLKNKDSRPLVNRIVSSLHALLLFYAAGFYWVVKVGMLTLFKLPRTGSIDEWSGSCIDIMVGYIYYDIVADIIPEIILKGTGEYLMIAHHVVGLASLLLIRIYDFAPGAHYYLVVFLAEASTPALHTAWTMEKLKQTSDPSFKVVLTYVGLDE